MQAVAAQSSDTQQGFTAVNRLIKSIKSGKAIKLAWVFFFFFNLHSEIVIESVWTVGYCFNLLEAISFYLTHFL